MSLVPPHAPLLAALVDELARTGLRHAVISPGSRNAPVVLALHAHPGIECWSVLDERAAAFMALGIAKASGMPAAVCVTSGTAVSNLLPAATEAHEAGVPLLLLTADRPHELRDTGAGQTIDQLRALDHVCRSIVEADLGAATEERERSVRAMACRAVYASIGAGARSSRPGPVQLNLPLRKPLTAPGSIEPLTGGRRDGAPWLALADAEGTARPEIDNLARRCLQAERGVIVAGRSERAPGLAVLLPRLAAALDWPLLADPMSGARRGAHAVAPYDQLLRTPAAEALVPDFILRAGDLPVSQALRDWLASSPGDAPQVMLTPEAVWSDPDSAATEWLLGEPAAVVAALTAAISGAREGATDDQAGVSQVGWTAGWHGAGASAQSSRSPAGTLDEAQVASTLATALSPDATLVVGASLPIRMLERWAPATNHPPRVLSNRGANGIDGVIATAAGALATGPGGPVYAYVGDLTLLYDQGGLLALARLGLPLQIVVVNNGGGRIFERLPVAEHGGDAFEPLIATPHDVDLGQLAALHRIDHYAPTTKHELRELLAAPVDRARLIEARVAPLG